MKNISRWSYDEIRKSGSLSKKLSMWLSVFIDSEVPLTARQATEIANRRFGLNQKMTSSNTNISNLLDENHMGFIKTFDVVKCPTTGKTVGRYIYTGRRIPREKVSKLVRCECCEGRGSLMKDVWIDNEKQGDMFPETKTDILRKDTDDVY